MGMILIVVTEDRDFIESRGYFESLIKSRAFMTESSLKVGGDFDRFLIESGVLCSSFYFQNGEILQTWVHF